MNVNHEDKAEVEEEVEEEEEEMKKFDLALLSTYTLLYHNSESNRLDFDCLWITLLHLYLAVEYNLDFKCHPKFN